MAKEMERQLQSRGFVTEQVILTDATRPAVIGRVPVKSPRYRLMFENHLDTVGVSHMTIPPFAAEERDGRLYGRGACDMKGSTAAMLVALSRERVQAIKAKGIELMVVCAPDEECGTAGAKRLAERGIGADHCIVLEPTGNQPVIAHSGCRWYEISLFGTACHGSEPHKGMSTNLAAVELLEGLFSEHRRLAEKNPDPLLGESTLNLGILRGGTALNIVPDHTVIGLDRRVVPSEDPALFENALQQMLNGLITSGTLKDAGWKIVAETPSFATGSDSRVLRQLSQAIQKVSGECARPAGTAWVSDAAPFSQTCGEILVWGPGDISQAHTEDEWVSIQQLNEAVEILETFLDAL